MSRAPMYRQLANVLRSRVETTPAGGVLPSEHDFAQQHGVSRMTARLAMKELELKGLVYRVPGVGTFSAGAAANHLANNELRSFTTEMTELGRAVRSVVLTADWLDADGPASAALRLPPEQRIVRVKRVRFADAEPLAIELVLLKPQCSFLLSHDLRSVSMYQLLSEHGMHPTAASASLSAANASASEAELLGVDPGSPLLLECRLIRRSGRTADRELPHQLQLKQVRLQSPPRSSRLKRIFSTKTIDRETVTRPRRQATVTVVDCEPSHKQALAVRTMQG